MEKIDTPHPFLKSKDYAVKEKAKPISIVQTCKEMRRGLSVEQEVLKNNLFHIKLPFPWKLHELLEHVERDSNDHIIAWLPCGRAFKIHKPDEFCDSIMTKYFRQTQFKSFTRQVGSNLAIENKYRVRLIVSSRFVVSHLLQKLYTYGFSKIERGDADGAFAHPEFVKGNRSLCLTLGRNRFGDRRLKKSRKQARTPMAEEFERPRNACMSSIQVLGRSNEAAGSLKAERRNCPFIVGSTLSSAQERLVAKGRVDPNITTSNPGFEGLGDLVASWRARADGNGTTLPAEVERSSGKQSEAYDPVIDIPLREPYVTRSARAVGNRTPLPEKTSTFDWVIKLEKKFLFQKRSHPSLGVMSTDMFIVNDLEPRPIEKMHEDL
jgi:hypothetical protein